MRLSAAALPLCLMVALGAPADAFGEYKAAGGFKPGLRGSQQNGSAYGARAEAPRVQKGTAGQNGTAGMRPNLDSEAEPPEADDLVQIETAVTAQAGFDSNYLELFEPIGSSFQQVDAQSTAIIRLGERTGAVAEFLGTLIKLPDLALQEWWHARFSFDFEHHPSAADAVSAGILYDRDGLRPPETVRQSTYLQFARDDALHELQLKGSIEDVSYLTGDLEFGETHPAEFNYVRSELRFDAMAHKDRSVSPYFQGVVARVRHPFKFISTDIDRDAIDLWVAPGLRFRPADRLRFDLGVRYNRRVFSDPLHDEYSTWFFDGSFEWTPHERLTVTGSVNRSLREANSEFSVVQDLTSYNVGVAAQLTDKFSVSANAYYDRIEEIGDAFLWHERYVHIEASYMPAPNMRWFVALFAKRGKEELSGLEFERASMSVGGSVSF